MNLVVNIPLELTFTIEARYSPGRPETLPSYSSGGDPPEPAEVEMEKLLDITVQTQVWNETSRRYDRVERSIMPADPVFQTLLENWLASQPELESDIADAVCNEAEKEL